MPFWKKDCLIVKDIVWLELNLELQEVNSVLALLKTTER